MNKDELYKEKGRVITEIELLQLQLQNINKQIVNNINESEGDEKCT